MGPAMFFRLGTLADTQWCLNMMTALAEADQRKKDKVLLGAVGCLRVCICYLHSKWGVPITNGNAQAWEMALVSYFILKDISQDGAGD